METPKQERNDIVPAHLAVQAMRDNGYKNAAYAIAELVDNSIQAEATQVELLCGERTEELNERRRLRINKIGVLDNGTGMDSDVLGIALQFGNGTHLNEADGGIGKFGMGLPTASISQCRRVDVWSWQDGPDNALYTYIDLDKIKNKEQTEILNPTRQPVPDLWRRVGSRFDKSGTLVVWSQLDRVMWKTARTIINHSELLVGRMYRYFLESGDVEILFHPFDLDAPERNDDNIQAAQPADPLYLMDDTSCPEPYGSKSMFEMWGDEPVVKKIRYRGLISEVKVTFSVAREEARTGRNAGSLPHGKHAKKNVGVSIVRAGRELEMNQSWTNQYDPRERWWGVEIEFPPSLDDLFGVTNNKQTARHLNKIDENDLSEEGETTEALIERLQSDNDPIATILDLSKLIDSNLHVLRRHIENQKKGTETSQSQQPDEDERHATQETKKRQAQGFVGESDADEDKPATERKAEIRRELEDEGLTSDAADKLAARTVDFGLKYTFVEAGLESAAFFSVRPKGGSVIITLNTAHPAYENLIEVLDTDMEDDMNGLRERLQNARSGLRLLLMAWARYEDELRGDRRNVAQDARYDWGRVARQFLHRDD